MKHTLEDYYRSFSISPSELGISGPIKHPYTALGEEICEMAKIVSEALALGLLMEHFSGQSERGCQG